MNNNQSTRENFIYWTKNIYHLSRYSVKLQMINPAQKIDSDTKNFKIKITNTSRYPMLFSSPDKRGVYLYAVYYSTPPAPKQCGHSDFSIVGKNDNVDKIYITNVSNISRTLMQNDSLDLNLELPFLNYNKKYRVELQLMQDGQFFWGEQGNKILIQEFELA